VRLLKPIPICSRPPTSLPWDYFHRGSQEYDANQMGDTDGGLYVFDTAGERNSNAGHDYGTKLTAEQKRELMEYLKTL
jgi:hypothetical protein